MKNEREKHIMNYLDQNTLTLTHMLDTRPSHHDRDRERERDRRLMNGHRDGCASSHRTSIIESFVTSFFSFVFRLLAFIIVLSYYYFFGSSFIFISRYEYETTTPMMVITATTRRKIARRWQKETTRITNDEKKNLLNGLYKK